MNHVPTLPSKENSHQLRHHDVLVFLRSRFAVVLLAGKAGVRLPKRSHSQQRDLRSHLEPRRTGPGDAVPGSRAFFSGSLWERSSLGLPK